ncbi:MAG: hypothetical protein ACKV0T_03735, partial [Planctomycetales bacterium]
NLYEWVVNEESDYAQAPDVQLDHDFNAAETVGELCVRAIRGGAFHRQSEASRAAFRHKSATTVPNRLIGFRIALTLD